MRAVGLFALAILILPIFVHADALININTASVATLNTLPYVKRADSSIAMAIVDYRTKNGSFSIIEDIMKVTGIKEGIFGHIQSLITVGNTDTVHNATSNETDTVASSTTSDSIPEDTVDSSTNTPTPSNISVNAGPDVTALIQVPFTFTASVKTKNGTVDSSASVHWSFGDGSATDGRMAEKTYRYTGTYLVVVTATDGLTTARDEIVVTVKPAEARIAAISDDGIILANDADEYLDLSNWRLYADFGSFRIPEGTTLLPKSSALFPYTVTNLPTAFTASLAYPNGIIATRYVPPIRQAVAVAQLATTSVSYTQVQKQKVEPPVVSKVESIISTKTNIQKNEEAVIAPAAATELAAAGAALSSVSPVSETGNNTHIAGIFHSPWTLGLLGIILVAGGAFILL